MATRRADLLVGDGTTEARQNRLKPLNQASRIRLLLGAVISGGKPLPCLHRRRREGVNDVMPGRCQIRIQQRRHRHKDHPLLVLHPLPVFKQEVMAVSTGWNQIGPYPQMQGEKRGRRHIAATPEGLLLRGVGFIHQRLPGPLGAIVLPRKGVPAGGIGDHPLGPDGLAIGQLHTNRLTVLEQHLGDPRLVANGAAMAFKTMNQLFSDHSNTTTGVVDATGMAIGKHHAGIDHRGAIGWHHRPAEAFDVDELQQLLILDVLAGDRTDIEGQPAGQPQTGQW